VLTVQDAEGAPLPDGAVERGEPFLLSGAGSADVPPGRIGSYVFTRLSGGLVTQTTDPTLTIRGDDLPLGSHVYSLEVVDESGNVSDPVLATIVVVDSGPPVAVLEAYDRSGRPLPDGTVVPLGVQFILDGSSSFDAPPGPIVRYVWTLFNGRQLSTGTPRLTDSIIVPRLRGTYSYSLVVADDAGNWSTAANLRLRVE
jgi:hypothetical protein